MNAPLIDSHVNLHSDAFSQDLDAVLERARAVGVSRFISICDRLDRFPAVHAIAQANDDIWCSVGVHPHHAKDFPGLQPESLVDAARDPLVCAIGETGLDQHYGYSDIALQERSLRVHIEAARETGLPIVIHTREADDLTGDVLEDEHRKGAFSILMHCYTGGERLAARALDLGAVFSVSGILSFKSAAEVRTVMARIPMDRVILETDCPYLAPTPHRGRRNEPAFLKDVCAAYAALRGVTQDEAASATTAVCLRTFGRLS
ncbi:YchF/TatD family DNA exonuclease [bacterium]|nr:YchF/TatD family DNA exonuclease [bacterium]